MSKFGSSQAITRVEDERFLRGRGGYIDDIAPENALHGFVLRSTIAHGRIIRLETEDAKAAPGVALILTADDLAANGLNNAMRYTRMQNEDGPEASRAPRTILSDGQVRFVGEAVAFIVADSLDHAKDAAELIELDIDELPVKLDLKPGGPALHDDAPDNVVYDWSTGDGAATQAALDEAAHVVTLTTYDNRIIVNSLEPRGVFAERHGEKLHVAINGQGVWGMKSDLAKWFDLDEALIRVTNPDVGGGFGMKAMGYPEHFLVALACRLLNRPVRWFSDRSEAMLSDNGGRDLSVTCTLGFDQGLKIVAYKVESLSNIGAFSSQFGQPIQSNLFARVLCGPYDIQQVHFRNRGIYTNTTQIDAYRGAGRPEAIYALERVMDRAARELGIDPLELRRRNFIRPDAFPYRSATGEIYDVGAFERVMGRARVEADLDNYAKRKRKSETEGMLRGWGMAYYIESILGDPSETAHVELLEDRARLFVGTQSNGQGHETVYRQLLHDQTGLALEQIEIVQGDSDLIEKGGGTGGSRSVTVQGMAIHATAKHLISELTVFLAEELDVPDIAFAPEESLFRSESSNLVMSLLEAATRAREAGRSDLTTARQTTTLPGRSYPNGCHIAEVEIDPETGISRVDRYTIVDDFGVLMNPTLAEGQVHGGVAQGIGQAMLERVVHDDDGQLLTASFMDYAMPRADNLPMFTFRTEPVPSTANPLGMKGCGEAGTVGALGAVANAMQDALWPLGITEVDMPFTPHRIWQMITAAGRQDPV